MNDPQNRSSGFTIVEVVVAASLLVVTITLAMSGLIYLLSESTKGAKQTELDIEVQIAMERLKRDIRLSSLDKMYYLPPGQGPYVGISFPIARDQDGDGVLDVATNGALIWAEQIIYHVWVGSPNQLRVTTFNDRISNLTDAQRQQQLASVVSNGTGVGTYNGTNSSTVTIFENLFDWELAPLDAVFDGYASSPERSINVNLGSISLAPSNHTLRFTVVGKNALSSGYRIGVDSLYASPSLSVREGENLLPVSAQAGATASNQYVTYGSWSGNYDLDFRAVALNHYVELNVYNDLWTETNFRATGETHDNTEVDFDNTLAPYDFVLALSGNETNWTAIAQTGATNYSSSISNDVSGCAIRVLIRGEEMHSGNWISSSGGKCAIAFSSGASQLGIRHAFIAEASSTESNTTDHVSSTLTRLTFSGGNAIDIPANSTAWSDLVGLEIDAAKSYLVSYLVSSASDKGSIRKWPETHDSSFFGTFVIPDSSNPAESDTTAALWSARGDVLADNSIYGVDMMFVTYVTNGIYTSRIFDTQKTTPVYNAIAWNSVTPVGSSISFKVRTASDSAMTNASAWASLSSITTSGSSISPGNQQYLQFQASMTPNPAQNQTPKLLAVTIDWPGNEQFVDVGGTFSKGPDYGIFKLTVDD
ncbi:MAG: hypothetical protein O3C57_04110, partial [Verrucomicrobia bacterium]|nr:hypothetical protein [Verrucomicrobiota bacterium]